MDAVTREISKPAATSRQGWQFTDALVLEITDSGL